MGKRLRPLTGLDALFLYLESAGTPMHVASLMRLERPKRAPKFAETVRGHLLARLSPLPIVRRQLVEAPLALGHPSWREAPDTDIADHVSIRRVAAPVERRSWRRCWPACMPNRSIAAVRCGRRW